MDAIATDWCGLPHVARLLLMVGLVFSGLFAALGGLTLTQLAVPALRAARILGTVALVIGLLAVGLSRGEPASAFLLPIASLPLIFGGLVFLAARKMAREARQLESAGKARWK